MISIVKRMSFSRILIRKIPKMPNQKNTSPAKIVTTTELMQKSVQSRTPMILSTHRYLTQLPVL